MKVIPATSQPGTVPSLEAAAVVGFASSQQTQWVKAVETFFIRIGETVGPGDFVELSAITARSLVHARKAILSSKAEAEAAAAAEDATSTSKSKAAKS